MSVFGCPPFSGSLLKLDKVSFNLFNISNNLDSSISDRSFKTEFFACEKSFNLMLEPAIPGFTFFPFSSYPRIVTPEKYPSSICNVLSLAFHVIDKIEISTEQGHSPSLFTISVAFVYSSYKYPSIITL